MRGFATLLFLAGGISWLVFLWRWFRKKDKKIFGIAGAVAIVLSFVLMPPPTPEEKAAMEAKKAQEAQEKADKKAKEEAEKQAKAEQEEAEKNAKLEQESKEKADKEAAEKLMKETEEKIKLVEPTKKEIAKKVQSVIPEAKNISISLMSDDTFMVSFDFRANGVDLDGAKNLGKEKLQLLINTDLGAKIESYHVVIMGNGANCMVNYTSETGTFTAVSNGKNEPI